MVFNSFKVKRHGSCNKTFQRNKNFRRFAYKIGNVLCITPWYDFEKEDLKKPIVNKVCATIYSLLFGVFLLTAKVIDNNEMEDTVFEKILALLSSGISILLTEFLIFGSTFIKQHNWEQFLRKLSMSQPIIENWCDSKTIISFYVQFIIGHIFFIGGFSYQGYIWYNLIGNKFTFPFLSLVIPEYYCLIYVLLSSNVALVIKCLYQDLNRLLEKHVDQYTLRNQEEKREEKFVKYLLGVGKQYRYISELVDHYNDIFGWVTLLIFWHVIVQLLRCANVVLDIMDDPRFSWTVFLSLLGMSTISMIESASIILCCEMASTSGEKLQRISHKLQENFDVDSASRKELFKLAEIVTSHKPKFTAANFFVINKGTILGIIHITTTYLIVLIQFNAKIHGKYVKNPA